MPVPEQATGEPLIAKHLTDLGALLFRVNYRTVTRLLVHHDLAKMVVLHRA
jgi:hypothetical protein